MTRHRPVGAIDDVFTFDDLGRRMTERRKDRRKAHRKSRMLHSSDGFHKLATVFGLLAFLVFAVIGAVTAVPSTGSVQGRIGSAQDRLNQIGGRKQVLTSDLSRLNDQVASLSGQVAQLRSSEAKVQAELDAEQAKLIQVENDLAAEKKRLAQLRRKLERSVGRLSSRLVAIFRENEPDLVTVALNSNGFSDMLHNVEFMNRITQADGDLVREVTQLKAESKRKAKHLAELEKQVQATVDSIRAKRDQIASQRQQVEARAAELAAAQAKRRAALVTVRSQQSRLEGSVASLQKQQERVAAQVNQTATAGPPAPVPAGPIKRGSGQFIWPVNGPIVGAFGEDRGDHMHAGIDIASPGGTPIRAAGAGSVSCGAQSGYGNTCVVSHSGGLSTLYAHMSRYAGVSGSVSQGQVIGYVGCTGTCYGDHLHFEVHSGGSAVNPLGYL